MTEEQKTLLGCAFRNTDTENITYFVSNTMILGERGAVNSFTRLIKPLIKHTRLLGWRGIVYIDDYGYVGETKEKCQENGDILRQVAKQAGWIFSETKETDHLNASGS